ncbi:S8/S53 family peptidase [Alkalilimnicola ehrlichii]|uniref:S8/S53 family peptidase n=1 Tax=Alkalilimnicola ehrlichii TaxID=351052 RepID=UPI0015F2632A|nr:S8/S53 family peptidase [Alkalilimnicola ehrlichii]
MPSFKKVTVSVAERAPSLNWIERILDGVQGFPSRNGGGQDSAQEDVSFEISELFSLPANVGGSMIGQFREYGLHRFFVLELEHEFNDLKAALGDGTQGRLNELKYKLQDGTELESVALDLPFDGLFGSFVGGSTQPLADEHAGWHLQSIGATREGPGVATPDLPAHLDGSGITIAHPDTGWTMHPELDVVNLDLNNQFNVINPFRSAREPLDSPMSEGDVKTLSPHHGTATGSLIMSRHRADVAGVSDVLGVAPGAKLIPIRCASHVVLVGGVALSKAVLRAVLANAHVISMSLGGFGSRYLQSVLKFAVARNIIPVAAAGNGFPLVVCPAIYNETIGVAAISRQDAKMDTGNARFISASGCGVDIAAPGACVNRAYWDDEETPVTGASDGTSYATALTAGAAALWLQHHGRDELIARLRVGERLIDVFRAHLKASARVPLGWDTQRMGAGVLNVPALLGSGGVDEHFNQVLNPLNIALARPLMTHQDVVVKMMCPILSANEVRELLQRALGIGAALVERMAEEVEQLIRTSIEIVEAVGEAVRGHLQGVVNALIDTLRGMLDSVSGPARAALEAAIANLENGVNVITAWGDEFQRIITDALESLGDALGVARDAILSALENAKEKIEEAFDAVAGAVNDVVDKVSSTLGSLLPA